MSIIFGTPIANSLNGTALSDLMIGGYGNDTISGGNGTDLVLAGYGDDQITVGTGHTTVAGGAGLDTVTLAQGAWFISPPGTGNFGYLQNLSTGQSVALTEVEQVKIGTTLIKFATGSDLADTVTGTNAIDYFRGLDGNDKISTLDGNDWVSSGNGADTVFTGNGNDVIDDRIQTRGSEFGTAPVSNVFNLGAGNDIALINLNFDFLSGTPRETYKIDGSLGTDIVYLDGFSNGLVSVNAGGDIVTSGFLGGSKVYADLTGIEQIVGIQDNKVWTVAGGVATEGRPVLTATKAGLAGTALSEDLRGNALNNVLTGNGGYDRYFGGAGTDTVVLTGRAEQMTAGDFLDLTSVQNGVTGVVLNSEDPTQLANFIANDIETLKFLNGPGAADDQSFHFKIVTNTVVAPAVTAGNDFAIFDAGAATIPSISGLAGDDFFFGQGNVGTVDGGVGNDHVTWAITDGKSSFLGGDGEDVLTISQGVSQKAGLITVDGGIGNDVISTFGSALTAKLSGGDGDDFLGLGAKGTADGGAGNDHFSVVGFVALGDKAWATVTGGAGDDYMDVYGQITDYLITKTAGGLLFAYKPTGATVNASGIEAVLSDETAVRFADIQTANIVNAAAVANTVNGGTGLDIVNGGAGNDKLSGNDGNDILAGDAGNDALLGGNGEDILAGGDGNDSLNASNANDIVVGGAGNDTMIGGTGPDQFWFDHERTSSGGGALSQGADRILDFQGAAGDVMVIKSFDDQMNSFDDAIAAATQVGANTVINFGDYGTLTLMNVLKTSLVADDFHFIL